MSYPLETLFLLGAFAIGVLAGACISVSKIAKPPQWDNKHDQAWRDWLDRGDR